MLRAMVCVALAAVCGSYAGAEAIDKSGIPKESTEWCNIWIPNADREDLPRVLLIGDSITHQYAGRVAEQFKGRAYVAYLTTSWSVCNPLFLQQLGVLFEQYDFDVVHFNNGLHGFGYSDEAYEACLRKAFATLKEWTPRGRVLWASSTPLRPASEAAGGNEKVDRRNEIAARLAKEFEIPVNDLNSPMRGHPEWYTDNYHFNDEAKRIQARQAAEMIGEYLPDEADAGETTMGKLGFQEDTVETAQGPLKMTFIGHGTLMFEYEGKVVHVDPWSNLADYSKLPDADIVLITHDHRDHLDPEAIGEVRKEGTEIVLAPSAAGRLSGGRVLENGGTATLKDLRIEAVPAYNLVHKRSGGQPYHPRGAGNGYIIHFGDTRVYVAGDTENTPEMKGLRGIDVAFLPMNLPYTMTPEMVADAARAFKPKILYPYHYGDTDTGKLVDLLEGSGVEVRIRKMQ